MTDSPRLEAELLLAECTCTSRAGVMAHPERIVAAEASALYTQQVERRAQGVPFAHIVGHREFFGLQLAVTADVLVPRPETELLVDLALGLLLESGASVLDLGTGSGAIALALKSKRSDLAVTAVDSSESALAVARQNADVLKQDARLLQSDWYAELAGECFDLIVSNPPYVKSDDPHFSSGLEYEPRLALDGGADGLNAYREILSRADEFLKPGGRVLLEHGFDQRDALLELAAEFGFVPCVVVDDLAGHPRAIALARNTDV